MYTSLGRVVILFSFASDYHAINTHLSTNLTNNTVVVSEGIKLTCSAQGNPPAKYRFFDSLPNSTVAGSSAMYTTSVSERIRQMIYSCTPFNYYGDGPTDTVTVTVHCKYMSHLIVIFRFTLTRTSLNDFVMVS